VWWIAYGSKGREVGGGGSSIPTESQILIPQFVSFSFHFVSSTMHAILIVVISILAQPFLPFCPLLWSLLICTNNARKITFLIVALGIDVFGVVVDAQSTAA